MSNRLFSLATTASLAVAVAAQTNTFVTPSGLTNAYGAINNSIPWGPFVPSGNTQGEIMVQQIEDEFVGRTVTLQSMAFRHSYNSTYGAKTYTAQVTVGEAASGAAGMVTTFANNFKVGGNRTVVANGAINFPAFTPFPRPPAAFGGVVLFSPTYTHLGNDPLIWEVIISQSSPVTPTHFFERGPGTTQTAGWVGTGCPISGGTSPLSMTGTANATTMTNNLANGPLSSPGALMVGDTSPTFNSVPLPIGLGFIGSPACSLNINVLVFLGVTTTATGTAAFPITYTLSPSISGARLRTQYVALDGLSVVTSNGLDHAVPYNATTGRPWPQNRVYANGFGATPPATGLLQNNGLVTQWTY